MVIEGEGGMDRSKGAAGASSTSCAGRSTAIDDSVVVTQGGRRVKLTGTIENPWSHDEPLGNGFSCNYYPVRIKGGGVSRLREHLGGLSGNVVSYKNVPLNVKALMTDEVAIRIVRRKRNKDLRLYVEKEVMQANRDFGTFGRARIPPDEAGQIEMAMRESLREHANTSPFGSTEVDIRATLSNKEDLRDRIMEVINTRLRYLNEMLMAAAAALDPEAQYRSKLMKK